MTDRRPPRWLRWPDPTFRGLAFGADYNPEQWPREVWHEDVRAMRTAGVNIVSVAIFSWAELQPDEDTWSFPWLDEVMDLLHVNGIAVCLATATASPPPWLTTKHPDILPVNVRGETVWPGARQHWRPTSPTFRQHALRLAGMMAERYGKHPALAAWHASNELGCHNAYDYSDDAARAFRVWLQERYQTLEGLNAAWATAFWSQRYSDWAQILPPRLAASHPNPTQQLDYKRFSSDALRQYLAAETALLREITPDIPVTTNFMIMDNSKAMNYASWATDVDFVANDHYVVPGPQAHDELSFSANLTSNLAAGQPWFLMEHSTSAVNWQPINVPKRPGELIRDSLTHVAHGADAVCFFQWRQSAAGAEKYHSAMIPHVGQASAVFRSVTELGHILCVLAPIAGSRREPARAAVLFHWESWWASEADSHPSSRLNYRQEALNWYTALLEAGVRADVVPLGTAMDTYDLVIAPMLHLVTASVAKDLQRFVEGGGHLVTTYFSGIVDENDRVWLGGYPGALRDLLGIRIEEFGPLLDEESVRLDNDAVGTQWSDDIDVVDPAVEVIARYRTGERTGRPAITRRRIGAGSATYVSTRLDPPGLRRILDDTRATVGVTSELPPAARGLVELVIRRDDSAQYWFLINRTDIDVQVTDVEGELLIGARATQDTATPILLAPRGVAVLRRVIG